MKKKSNSQHRILHLFALSNRKRWKKIEMGDCRRYFDWNGTEWGLKSIILSEKISRQV